MIQIEPIQAIDGFGIGTWPGIYSNSKEYFYSQGMSRTQFGVAPKWSITNSTDSGTLTNMVLGNWFSQGQFSGNKYVYSFHADGRINRAPLGSASYTQQRFVNGVDSHGNGLIFDQTNRLLYANDRYLGMSSDGAAFTDNWKDFGAGFVTTDLRPMDTYEDWVVIGNINQVALLNVTDDSFNANALNLPTGFQIRCIKAGKNGILIGANFNNRGVLILWDAFSTRSIAPWIWRNANIQAIVPTDTGWIVFTRQEIFSTDGYSVQPILSNFPDHLLNDDSITANLLPQGAETEGNLLFFWGTTTHFNRQMGGIYILNLSSKLFEFVPVASGVTFGVTGGAIFFDNQNFIQVSYATSTPFLKVLGRLASTNPTQAFLISEQVGQGDNEKVAEGVKYTLGVSSNQTNTPDLTFNASVKIYNFRRNLFTPATTRAVSTSADVLKIDGSTAESNSNNKAQVGDEVTILEGPNAGQIRHITAIANQGTNTEEWTLDSVLPNNTASLIHMVVSPFKLARKYTFSNVSELNELYFDVQNKIKGKKFLVKLLLENMPTSLMVEIKGGQFITSDLGIQR